MQLMTGIFSDLLDDQRAALASEKRSSLENPQTPLSYPAEWLLDIFNGGRTDSGIRVSELTAFQATYFLACVDLIAGTIASLPLYIYERVPVANGRVAHRIAYEHNLYELIHLEPNDEMSRFTMLKAYLAHMLAWGNGYIEVARDGGNQPTGLWPRNPYKTRPHRLAAPMRLEPVPWRPFPVNLHAGELVYRTTDGIDDMDESDVDAENARYARFIPKEDMLHVPGLAFDGRIGQSVVWLARQTIGLALATEKFGAKYFANYAKPGGILEMPGNQNPQAREQTKQSWMEAQGGENSHRVAVVPPGTKFTAISNKPDESQLTETEDKLRNKICAFFHVPTHMMGDNSKGRANTEQNAQEFLSYTISPWIAAINLEWKRKLFPSSGVGRTPRSRFYVDFDTTDLLRPDAASREKFYATGKQWGYLCSNDVRGFEKLNPIDDPSAEEFWMPINMTLVSTPIDPTHQDGDGDGDSEEDPAGKRLAQHFSRLFRDAFGRVTVRRERDLAAIQGAFSPLLFSIRDSWFALAAGQMRLQGQPGAESERFIAEYCGALQKRSATWALESADEIAKAELQRAVRALRSAAYREAATLKAAEGDEHAPTVQA